MGLKVPIDADILAAFVFWAAIVLLKTMFLVFWTVRTRMRKAVFANPEDAATGGSEAKVKFDDDDVERVRRCHLNDMENVFPFVLIGFLYCLSGPSGAAALWHFRAFGISRLIHTVVYLGKVPQPSRAMAFGVGAMANISMAVQALLAVCC